MIIKLKSINSLYNVTAHHTGAGRFVLCADGIHVAVSSLTMTIQGEPFPWDSVGALACYADLIGRHIGKVACSGLNVELDEIDLTVDFEVKSEWVDIDRQMTAEFSPTRDGKQT